MKVDNCFLVMVDHKFGFLTSDSLLDCVRMKCVVIVLLIHLYSELYYMSNNKRNNKASKPSCSCQNHFEMKCASLKITIYYKSNSMVPGKKVMSISFFLFFIRATGK